MTMEKNNRIDLHTHSNASDGVLSAKELLERAVNNNIDLLAITDHDTVSGYRSVQARAGQLGINLITGVELSTVWSGLGVHIVGLNFDPNHQAITTLLDNQRTARKKRCEQILQRLTNLGLPLTLEELQANVGSATIGRPHIAQLMVDKGYAGNTRQAFKKYLGTGKIGDVKNTWVSLSAGVAAIRAGGGVAAVAHPNHYQLTRSKLLRLLDDFIAAGGQGIEVIAGKQQRDITEKMANIANDKGLYASTGSDFHRPLAYTADVGELPPLPDSVKPIWHLFD
ncbi:MAG: phosphatase [Gammaproteobacteria bacterium]|nr:MAG: phosphatase [Gammaproteobacteria bacterium]